MRQFIVTIKLPKNGAHNPLNKVIGMCPVVGIGVCTDITGEHHSFLVEARSNGTPTTRVREYFMEKGYHVTRVEVVTQAKNLLDI